ncbi:MAG: hypothetical protein ACXU9G_05065, partial [Syntrophales bacterium]
ASTAELARQITRAIIAEQIIAVILVPIRILPQNKKGLENPRPFAKKSRRQYLVCPRLRLSKSQVMSAAGRPH